MTRAISTPARRALRAARRGQPRTASRTSWIYRVAWIFYLVLALGGALWVGARQGRIALELFFDPASWWLDLLIGLVAGGLLVVLWLGARRILPTARDLEGELAELLGPLSSGEIIGLALLSGFAEELFFRGAVQGAWGWIPATILFALLHAGPGPSYRVWTAFAAVAGLALAGLMLWRGNLLAPVVTHVLVNGVNLQRLVAHPVAEQEGARPSE
jgi:membrane protease YdiL (CAAX protease family)